MTAAKVIQVASKEVNYREGKSGSTWNNKQKYSPEVPGLEWSQGQAWCATFVAWVAIKAGVGNLYPRTASCDVGGKWFKDQGRWSEYPAIGAQAFFGTPSDLNHTGIVYDYDDTYIYTIEGNTNDSGSREGNGVYRKKRARRGANVIGYGYPAFPGGIKSADPALAKPAPAVAKVGKTPNITRAIKSGNAYIAALEKVSRKNPQTVEVVDAAIKQTRSNVAQLKRREVK